MKSGSFISLISDTYRVEEKTVTLAARLLKEAGLLTTGARGVNAPHMLPLDAARMTIALLATDSPAQMVKSVLRYRDMKIAPKETKGDLPPILFHSEPTLEQVLVRLFGHEPADDAFGSIPYFEIRENDKSAAFEMTGNTKAVFRTHMPTTELLSQDRWTRSGIRRARGLASSELSVIAVNLWVDRLRGCDLNGFPLNFDHPWNQELRGAKRTERISEINQYIAQRDPNWMKGA